MTSSIGLNMLYKYSSIHTMKRGTKSVKRYVHSVKSGTSNEHRYTQSQQAYRVNRGTYSLKSGMYTE